MFALLTIVFVYQPSVASKNGEFTFGIDKILTYTLRNSINYVDGQKVATKIENIENGRVFPIKEDKLIRTVDSDGEASEEKVEVDKMVDNVLKTIGSKDYGNNGVAPKLEYCYYVLVQEDKTKMGIGLGLNKFFNSDFDPFNVYAIWKIVLPANDKCEFSFGTNFGYGIFNDKYKTAKEAFKSDKVYSAKIFVKFDYKNFFVDLSAMTNIIPIDAKINTINEGIKSVKENINYNVIMLGIGYKFAI
jgi:hypothetical protein